MWRWMLFREGSAEAEAHAHAHRQHSTAQNTSSCAAKADEVRRRAELALCTLLAKIRGPAAARAPPHAAAANLVVLGPVFGAHARAPQYTHTHRHSARPRQQVRTALCDNAQKSRVSQLNFLG
jgi:hypothetical protein